ncbi:hypothetical protein ACOME3_006830 [Neoechinorhynchus agilis]
MREKIFTSYHGTEWNPNDRQSSSFSIIMLDSLLRKRYQVKFKTQASISRKKAITLIKEIWPYTKPAHLQLILAKLKIKKDKKLGLEELVRLVMDSYVEVEFDDLVHLIGYRFY